MITKGPIGLTDEIAFVASGAAPIPRLAAHRVALRRYHRHPKWAFRDPTTHALEPVYSVHYNDYAARLQGAQAAYDVGIQRTCWQIHSLTDWMGDDGFLKAADSQYRSHVYLSDVVRLGARVSQKEVDDDGDAVVHLETWARNQRDTQRDARHRCGRTSDSSGCGSAGACSATAVMSTAWPRYVPRPLPRTSRCSASRTSTKRTNEHPLDSIRTEGQRDDHRQGGVHSPARLCE